MEWVSIKIGYLARSGQWVSYGEPNIPATHWMPLPTLPVTTT